MSTAPQTIQAEVTFLSESEGGRSHPSFDNALYRPHLVIGSTDQRHPATAADGRTLTESYLGVSFTGQGAPLVPGTSHRVTLLLIYHPQVNYSALMPGTTFTIREGGHIVGFGVALSAPAT